MKRLLVFALTLTVSTIGFAQNQSAKIQTKILAEEDSLSDQTKGSVFSDMLSENDPVDAALDAFQRDYHYPRPTSTKYDTLLLNTQNYRSNDIPRFTQTQTRKHLYNLPTVIPMDYNIYVQRYIDVYALKRREQVSRMLGLARVYFPMFEEELDRMEMPIELKYLSVVESALNPHARSRVGATGLWQFMLSTGRIYGLEVNSFVDERKDPLKSTQAALKYLKNAKEEFGNWHLAIAAYNCGPGNVRKAIRRSGGKTNFWEIREYLPRETRGYVPAFIAATYVFEYASDFNIYPTYIDFSLYQDTLHLTQLDITLTEIASMCKVDVHALKNLNPELKLDRIPYSDKPYVLRVPFEVAEYFASNPAKIRRQYGKKRDQYIAPVAGKNLDGTPTPKPAGPPVGKKLVYYTVKSGDAVSTIAEKFGVSSRQIASWNNLRRYRIRAGQKLKIYTTPTRARQVQNTVASSAAPKPNKIPVGPGVYHTIRSGDTLWSIASQYPGIEVSHIQRLNPGLNARDLKVGQRVRVR